MEKKKILIIEDNPYNMRLMSDILQIHGYDVFAASSKEETLRILDDHKPSLILMDISLKDTDGLTLTRKIKSNPLLCDVPIIAVTAHAMENNKEDALTAGCESYITKPIDTRELPKIIERIIEYNSDRS